MQRCLRLPPPHTAAAEATIAGAVKRYIHQNNFTYFDMFVSDSKKYDPGVLTDIMHLGDYGWMKINEFLYASSSTRINPLNPFNAKKNENINPVAIKLNCASIFSVLDKNSR